MRSDFPNRPAICPYCGKKISSYVPSGQHRIDRRTAVCYVFRTHKNQFGQTCAAWAMRVPDDAFVDCKPNIDGREMNERLKWDQGYSDPRRFMIQTETVRGEGTCTYLVCSREDMETARRLDLETAFFGRGAAAKVRATAQQIADEDR